ncbi:MAG: glycosyltransferase family 2 protein [Lachnospiraceae bacterium]|nr:glycosyltransferase family 2 protein [Lachnospiraceae bacterium]
MKTLELVVPCYNEEKCIRLLYESVKKVFDESEVDIDWSVIYVNDGSKDGTLNEIQRLAEEVNYAGADGNAGADVSACTKKIKYVSFSRNFGKEAAINAGLSASTADYVALMDADLQHPPELLLEMVKELDEGYDVCGARRVSRKGEPVIRSFFSKLFYMVINRMTSMELVPGGSDFRMMKRPVVEAMVSMPEQGRFTKGIFSWVGFKTKWIPYHNVERAAGQTSWSFRGLASYAINGFFAFATTPLRIAVWLGFLVDAVTLVVSIRYIYRSLTYGAIGNGVGTLTIIVAFFGGTIILILGVIGEYLARIYLEVKNRPLYIVKETNITLEE